MQARSLFAGAALLALTLPALAASVTVNFLQPEQYADAGYSSSFASERDRAQVQGDVAAHIRRIAQARLAPSDVLQVDVLDIDLAGRFDPFSRTGSRVRIVSDASWPRMQLRYTLVRDGQVTASGEERISDMNFLATSNRYPQGDRLRYEKAMLDTWFQKLAGKD